MHGDEHVGLREARATDAVAQPRNSSRSRVRTARMPGSALMRSRKRARDRQRHVLLARAAVADGARILAAMPGVDRD